MRKNSKNHLYTLFFPLRSHKAYKTLPTLLPLLFFNPEMKKNELCHHVKNETHDSNLQRFREEIPFWPCCCPLIPTFLILIFIYIFLFFVHFQMKSLVLEAL